MYNDKKKKLINNQLVFLDTRYKLWRDKLPSYIPFIKTLQDLVIDFYKYLGKELMQPENIEHIERRILSRYMKDHNLITEFIEVNREKPLITYQKVFNDFIDFIVYKKMPELLDGEEE